MWPTQRWLQGGVELGTSALGWHLLSTAVSLPSAPLRPPSPPSTHAHTQVELGHGLAGVDADRAETILCVADARAAAALAAAAGRELDGETGTALVRFRAWTPPSAEAEAPEWKDLLID